MRIGPDIKTYYNGKYQFTSQFNGRPRLKLEAKKGTVEPPRLSRVRTGEVQEHASPKSPDIMTGCLFFRPTSVKKEMEKRRIILIVSNYHTSRTCEEKKNKHNQISQRN